MRGASARIAELQKELDKARVEPTVAQASFEKLKTDKEVAVKELVNVKLELAKEKSSREKADATLVRWRSNYTLVREKMNALFNAISPHLEICRPFKDDVLSFIAKYEPNDISAYDSYTRSMDEVDVSESLLVDKALVSQTDDLVNITEAVRHDENYPNPGDPTNDGN